MKIIGPHDIIMLHPDPIMLGHRCSSESHNPIMGLLTSISHGLVPARSWLEIRDLTDFNVKAGRIMGGACLKFRGENFHRWLKNREIGESFLPRKFPALR